MKQDDAVFVQDFSAAGVRWANHHPRLYSSSGSCLKQDIRF